MIKPNTNIKRFEGKLVQCSPLQEKKKNRVQIVNKIVPSINQHWKKNTKYKIKDWNIKGDVTCVYFLFRVTDARRIGHEHAPKL